MSKSNTSRNVMVILAVVALALYLWFTRKDAAADAKEDGSAGAVDNQPTISGAGNSYVTNVFNEMSPINLPTSPNPIYQAFYTTSPGIPDVVMNFTVQGENLDFGYIPLFGFIATAGNMS